VDEFQADRSLSDTPLFQVFFSLQNAPRAGKELSSVKTEALGEQKRAAKFDLAVDMMEVGDRIGGSFEYKTDIFEADTIRRMIGHFQTVLRSIVKDPERAISRLPLLTEVETQQLLSYSQCSESASTPDSCLHELFEAQVAQKRDAIAVVFEDQQLTYGELNVRANRLAHNLRELGVGLDVLVGICVKRSVEMVVGLLGILKAGGAYVPLDPAYPDARLAFMLNDSGAKILLTESALASRFSGADVHVLNIDFEHEWPGQKVDDNLPTVSSSEAAVYMIYTSGSTGQPKGAIITQSGLVNYLNWAGKTYELDRGNGSVVHSPLAFDLTVTTLWGPLLGGQPIQLIREDEGIDGLSVVLGEGHDYNVVKVTPSHLQALADLLPAEHAPQAPRTLIIGGDALWAENIAYWRKFAPDTRLINEYGPTETVVGCCVYEVQPDDSTSGPVPIGRPIGNTQLYILDEFFQLVPCGVSGELYIGGAGVGRGYVNQPGLTAERFVPDPFGNAPGGRLYRTGDLVRHLREGQIEYLGRLDRQVKIRGYRIELGEIESVFADHPRVREAVVVADKPAERLTAYVVSGRGLDVAELRRFVGSRVPAHMVPTGFVTLKKLPLTINGKIDRAALPAAGALMAAATDDVYVAARTPLEEILCGIWMELLSAERVGVHDNFFQLGGHSLLAIRVMARVREAFAVELPLRSLFEFPTIAAMAQQIELAIATNRGLLKPPIERIPRDGPLPLSYVTERRVERELWAKANSVYIRPQNVHNAIFWSGPLDHGVFEQSVNEIIRRHEILRTNFDIVDGKAMQFISEERSMTVRFVDLRHLNRETRKAEALQLASDLVKQRFDLNKDVLVRITIFQLDDNEYLIVFVADHVVCDGWSMDIFFTEFTALYDAFTKGEPAQLAELPFQYVDYSHWQRNWLQGEVLDHLLSYWKKQLDEQTPFPHFELPGGRPRPEVQDFAGTTQTIVFSVDLTNAIKSLTRRSGVTIFMMLLTGLKALLHRRSGRENIGIVTPAAYRTMVNTEALIGWFAQLLILRTDLSGDPSFAELLERVREVTLGAFTHQDIPLPYLLSQLATTPWSQSVNKVVPYVFFNLDNYVKGMPVREGNEAPVVPDVVIRKASINTRSSEACLSIDIKERASAFGVLLTYETSIYDAETISELLEHFESLMEAAVANPELRLSQLPLLTRAQREALKEEQEKAHDKPLADLCRG
jgi:amino acid adenylation domain-containing protein